MQNILWVATFSQQPYLSYFYSTFQVIKWRLQRPLAQIHRTSMRADTSHSLLSCITSHKSCVQILLEVRGLLLTPLTPPVSPNWYWFIPQTGIVWKTPSALCFINSHSTAQDNPRIREIREFAPGHGSKEQSKNVLKSVSSIAFRAFLPQV